MPKTAGIGSKPKVAGLNPKILQWARERAGYSLVDVADSFEKHVGVIEEWESGTSSPSYSQLEKLAYTLYKRPLALFFFPVPPVEKGPTQEFRTLPKSEAEKLTSDTRYALRQAQAIQLALKELNEGVNLSEGNIFRDIKASPEISAIRLADIVRKYLGVTVKTQSSWKSSEKALQNWRFLIQEKGIFVFKRAMKQKDISGFCLIDNEFPVIYLNNSTAKSRQSFSLFHELAHILLHTSGVTKQDDEFIVNLSGKARQVEVFANQFAAECLVPSADFERQVRSGPYNDSYFDKLANRYWVSREVVLRRFLDRGLVDQDYYDEHAQKWKKEFEESRKKLKGGDYFATKATYLGDKYLKLVFGKYYKGRLNIEQLADYLDIKVQNVAGLEEFVLKRTSP